MGLPWTKFQDFYLRLGFLKALVAVLDAERTSAANELIIRRLVTPLFDSAESRSPQLWERAQQRTDWAKRRNWRAPPGATGRRTDAPTVAEALIVDAECPSLLYAATRATAYKILDWGRNVGLVGRGNQITERGLLLRRLLPKEDVAAFLSGNALAWNPFLLTPQEKAFLFYHLCEIDRLTADVVRALGELKEDGVLELRDAGRLVCRAFHAVLDSAEPGLRPADLPGFRTARDLAAAMAEEMELADLIVAHGASRTRLRPGSRGLMATQHRGERKLTKNTDHQTVPRLEQLADLGFVRKQGAGFGTEGDSRRRWRWAPTAQCKWWRQATAGVTVDTSFLWSRFANAAAYSLGNGERGQACTASPEIAQRVWEAYEVVRRPVGHTPLDSIGLYATATAVAAGVEIEMNDVHRLMLILKRSSVLSEHAQFAGGNGLDEMFVRLRDGFAEVVRQGVHAGVLPSDVGTARSQG